MYMKVLSNRKNIDQIKSYEGRGTTPQKEKFSQGIENETHTQMGQPSEPLARLVPINEEI